MLIIIDKKTKKIINNLGTNLLFPDGNVPEVVARENELFVRVHDQSDIAYQISLAHDYDLELNDKNEVTNVIVHKTIEEYQSEIQPEQDLLVALQPTETEVRKAEIELISTNLLIELGVI